MSVASVAIMSRPPQTRPWRTTNADATRDNIVDGLDWIRLQTTAKDVAMIFMAGHGTNDTLNRYYFLPHNFNADRLASTGVTFTDIKNSVEAIAGKAVFFAR